MNIIYSQRFWLTFVGSYSAVVGAIWSLLEAYTYFKGDQLKQILGAYWLLIYSAPMVFALYAALFNVKISQHERVASEDLESSALKKIRECLQSTDSESKGFEVLALSACNYDNFIKIDKILPDHEYKVEEETSHPGGSGANTICGLAKLGIKTAIVGCVKNDEEGEKIIQSFRDRSTPDSYPIDVGLLIKDENSDSYTGKTIILVEDSGKRLISVKPGINESLARLLKERNLLGELRDRVRNSKIVHLTSFTGSEEIYLQELVVRDFINKNTIVSLTPGTLYVDRGIEKLSPILAHTNIMFLYTEQLDILLRSSSRIHSFRTNLPLAKKTELFFKWKNEKKMNHAMILVIKDNLKIQSNCILENYISVASNAGDSVSFFSHSNVNFTIGSNARIALDTTGVGDAVVAGFLYGLLIGENLKGCADIAFVLATHVSTKFGARDGLLDKNSLGAERQKLI